METEKGLVFQPWLWFSFIRSVEWKNVTSEVCKSIIWKLLVWFGFNHEDRWKWVVASLTTTFFRVCCQVHEPKLWKVIKNVFLVFVLHHVMKRKPEVFQKNFPSSNPQSTTGNRKKCYVTRFVFFRKMTSGKVGDDTYCYLLLFEPQPSPLSHHKWLRPL